jgi:hydroxyacylglutathione hydrolase
MLENARFSILDVRTKAEFERVHLPESTNIYVGHIPLMIDDLPQERPIVTFCGSGMRAMIAASLLRASGIEEVQTCMGSMAACTEVGCPIVTSRDPKLVRR